MIARDLSRKFAGKWLAACTLGCILIASASPVSASPYASNRDNSGRQLAQVIPGMPHPSAIPVTPPATKTWTSTADEVQQRSQHQVDAFARRLSSVSAPVQLSPEAKQALQHGVLAAQGLSRIALKRATDVITWVAVLFQNLDGIPRITPATTIAVPQMPMTEMRPINEPEKSEKRLYYTSENRLRTVVGR